MHLKRNEAPKSWPIPRKGTKSIVVPSHNQYTGIPVLILLRNMLKIAKDRKEVKRIIQEKKLKVNGKLVRDEKLSLILFDILEMNGKNYKLVLENKKFSLEETKDKEKTAKIIGKKMLSKGRIQINLNDGRNFMSKEKFNVDDSLVFNFEGKIVKKIEMKDGAKVIIIGGKHIGETGKVEKITGKMALLKLDDSKINLGIENLMAIY